MHKNTITLITVQIYDLSSNLMGAYLLICSINSCTKTDPNNQFNGRILGQDLGPKSHQVTGDPSICPTG